MEITDVATVHSGRAVNRELSRHPLFFAQIDRLQTNHPWFKLEPATVRVVKAFDTLQEKISGRLKDKKDLLLVANAMRNLARYLYSVIPDLSSADEGEHRDVPMLGEQALMTFAEEVEHCLHIEEQAHRRAAESIKKADTRLYVAGWLFSREALLVRFGSRWMLSQAVTVVALRIAFWFVPTLKVDSTLIVFVAGTPLLVAAAALAGVIGKK